MKPSDAGPVPDPFDPDDASVTEHSPGPIAPQNPSDRVPDADLFADYRAYLSVLAEIRNMFFERSEEEIIRTLLVHLANHFGLSKVWYGNMVAETIRPQYHAGPLRQHVDVTEVGIGPAARPPVFPLTAAVRDNRPVTLGDLDRNPDFAPWRDFAVRSRVRSLFAMPLEIDDKQAGGIVLYSGENDRFDSAVVDYLRNIVQELGRVLSEKRFWKEQRRLLRLAKEKAESAALARSRFLADMSHEIRTPMAVLLGYTEMIADPSMPHADRREAVFIIRNNVEYLLQILNDILDFSKIEADKLQTELRRVAVAPILEEIALLYANKAKEKEIELTLSNTTPFPESIRTDPVRLKQILLNLVGNAVKFTPQGTVEIVLSWVPDDGAARSGRLVVDVRDSGIGMEAETLETLFSPFQQADRSTARRFGGTGLGLVISRRLTEMLGGDIAVQSRPGHGSTFTVRFPQQLPEDTRWLDDLRQAGEDAPRRVEPTESPRDRHPLRNRRLLLAEDGHDNRRLFHLILSRAGAATTLVENGLEAYEEAMKCREENNPFDLIVMDMQMPVMDGYAAVRKLRESGYTEPIIALTAHAMPEERERCLAAGCDDYVSKPILRDVLIEVVLKNMEKRGKKKDG